MKRNRILVGGIVLSLLVGFTIPTSADVQSSVRRLLPATVAVQWTSQTPTDPYGMGASGVGETTANPYGTEYGSQAGFGLRGDGELSAEVGLSSGTVLTEDGLIVTAHLPRSTGSIEVTWMDGRRDSAKLVVDDRRTDLQLLKVEAGGLSRVELRQDTIELAQTIVTVTSTDLLDRAAGTGIVTAMNRPLGGKASDAFQTDIHTGTMSAGAPLGDTDGRVAGIIVGKKSESPREHGPAIAVPASYVQSLLSAYDPAKKDPQVLQRGWLGIQLNEDDERVDHPYIVEVFERSPAESVPLKQGDKILKLRGKRPIAPSDVVRILGHSQPGEEIDLLVNRDGEELQMSVKLGESPGSTASRDDDRLSVDYPFTLFVVDEDGTLKPYLAKDGTLKPYDNLGYVFLNDPSLSHELLSKETDDERRTKVRDLARWMKSGAIPGSSERSDDATIRVTRSDVEQQLNEVSNQVKSLVEQVGELTKALDQLNAKLKE